MEINIVKSVDILSIPIKSIYLGKEIPNLKEFLFLTKNDPVFYFQSHIDKKEQEFKQCMLKNLNFTSFDTNLINICSSYQPFKLKDLFNTITLEYMKTDTGTSSSYVHAVLNDYDNKYKIHGYTLRDIGTYEMYDLDNFAHMYIWLNVHLVGCYASTSMFIMYKVLKIIMKDNKNVIISTLITLYSYFNKVHESQNFTTSCNRLDFKQVLEYIIYDRDISMDETRINIVLQQIRSSLEQIRDHPNLSQNKTYNSLNFNFDDFKIEKIN